MLRFHNLTLGYERHPAVHHLDGAVEDGALLAVVGPNGAGKSTLFKGIVGVAQAARRQPSSATALDARDIAYLPQVADIDRIVSDQCLRHGRDGAVAREAACSAASAARITTASKRHRRGRPHRLRAARHRHAVGRPDAAHAVRAAAAAGRAADRARRAVHRHRCQDRPPTCSIWCGAGTAKSARCSRRCTTSIW